MHQRLESRVVSNVLKTMAMLLFIANAETQIAWVNVLRMLVGRDLNRCPRKPASAIFVFFHH